MNSRYAAKLLFQYRVDIGGASNKIRDVEERIVVVHARSAKAALKKIARMGESDQTTYENNDGNSVFIEFVGVQDLMHLGNECSESTVWYEVKKMLMPMERKNLLIPPPDGLAAFRFETREYE